MHRQVLENQNDTEVVENVMTLATLEQEVKILKSAEMKNYLDSGEMSSGPHSSAL